MDKVVLDETKVDDIIAFIDYVCYTLDIDPPKLDFDTGKMQSDTQAMIYVSDSDTIHINPKITNWYDFCRGVAHELRHKWQIEVDDEYYFGEYKQRKDCTDAVEYSSQLAEVDANAFSEIILSDYFHVVPLWQGVDERVVKLIKDYIPQIEEELD